MVGVVGSSPIVPTKIMSCNQGLSLIAKSFFISSAEKYGKSSDSSTDCRYSRIASGHAPHFRITLYWGHLILLGFCPFLICRLPMQNGKVCTQGKNIYTEPQYFRC